MSKDVEMNQTDNFTFGEAIDCMKTGHNVARAGWNGKGMFIYLQQPECSLEKVNGKQTGNVLQATDATVPYLMMYTATMDLVPWLASQTDILADDWQVVELNETKKEGK